MTPLFIAQAATAWLHGSGSNPAPKTDPESWISIQLCNKRSPVTFAASTNPVRFSEMPSRTVLIHYHIFKNAGSSVDASMKASFGNAWATFEGTHAHDIQSASDLSAFLQTRPDLLAVSSHLARPPLPWPGCLPVVFLRHPLLRALSVYEFTRNDPSQPYAHVANEATFADYIRWALQNERGSIVIRNYQVVHLSDASWRQENILDSQATQADLKQARDLLSAWGLAGIVESYELSARAFQTRYESFLPGLRFENLHENSTTPVACTMEEQLARVQTMLGQALSDEFMAINALDLALYEHARQLLDSTIKLGEVMRK
jgi:hypothetical protein